MKNTWTDYEKAAERGPFAIFWKAGAGLLLIACVLAVVGNVLGWCGEAAQVAHDEFGPRAALAKYEWFKEQSTAIKKMDQDIVLFEHRIKGVDLQYAPYGTDRSKWPLDVRLQYNHDRSQGRDDLVAVASQRNNLVKDYNAAGSKFNWKPFATSPDCPQLVFQEYRAPE